MGNKKDCRIVQDLLPNYIEGLTNGETNQYIEEHLKECEECKQVLENMKKDYNLTDTKREKREVNFLKKYRNKMKILKIILLIIVVSYVLVVLGRTTIMFSLANKAKENQEITNFYTKYSTYLGDTLRMTESYNMGEDYLTTITVYSPDEANIKLVFYKKGNEKLCLADTPNGKYLLDPDAIIGGETAIVTFVPDQFIANLQTALFVGIESTCCNGKECYVIKTKDYERYIDKQTGLAVREVDISTKDNLKQIDYVTDYQYQYNIVKDSDIIKPDVTEYKVIN